MGGFFGVASQSDCVTDLFYGTDYHSHLGTKRGGLAVFDGRDFSRYIHDITNTQFKSKFETDITKMKGHLGVGVISDFEDQPLLIGSHLGNYAIVTVGAIKNLDALVDTAFTTRTTHFTEMSRGEINPTELVATLINQEATIEDGIKSAGEKIEGSCSILVLTEKGIYAARDRFGRTPVIIGRKDGSIAVAMDTSAFPNLDYSTDYYLGPGEVVFIDNSGYETLIAPGDTLRICSFLWVYYGYPASSYEGINVEDVRNRNGRLMAINDDAVVDIVGGIPDSGTGHATGYANQSRIPYKRPLVKYTPTWSRSFMPQNQDQRALVARMKLIPVKEFIDGNRVLLCDDSIVRGTQMKDVVARLYNNGAKEIHLRLACPPLLFGCKYLNFSRSRSDMDLATRRIIKEMEGTDSLHLDEYSNCASERYERMVRTMGEQMGFTSLKFQHLDDLIKAIGLPREKLCTHCWDGRE